MRYLLFLVLLVTLLITAGCTGGNQKSAVTSTQTAAPATPTPATPPTTVITTTPTPSPTPVVPAERKITDGYWCRDTTMNLGKAPTGVRECYQFFSDGTYKWGYAPGHAMGKSPSCPGEMTAKCEYFINAKGHYEVQGGYSYVLSGDTLNDPHDPPYFRWSPAGIP
jgi:hypothetical protein